MFMTGQKQASRRKPVGGSGDTIIAERIDKDYQSVQKRRYKTMEGLVTAAAVTAVTVVLFPPAFVWYLTIKGMRAAAQEARQAKAAKVEAR